MVSYDKVQFRSSIWASKSAHYAIVILGTLLAGGLLWSVRTGERDGPTWWKEVVIWVVFLTSWVIFLILRTIFPSRRYLTKKSLAARTDLFEEHPNGKLVVAGHRIPLFALMESWKELGDSPNRVREIHSQYPSIEYEQLAELLLFLTEREEELAPFYALEKEFAQAAFDHVEKNRTGPTLEELKERRRKRHESTQTSG